MAGRTEAQRRKIHFRSFTQIQITDLLVQEAYIKSKSTQDGHILNSGNLQWFTSLKNAGHLSK